MKRRSILLAAGAAIAVVLLGAGFLFFSKRTAGGGVPAPGTRRMIARLEELRRFEESQGAEEADAPQAGPWRFNRPWLIPGIRREIEGTTSPGRLIPLHFKLVNECLWDGRNQDALDALGALDAIITSPGISIPPAELARMRSVLRVHVATCFLRMAERANCIASHNPQCCMLPIQGGGIHRDPGGSRSVIEVMSESLAEDPRDMGARWLLNLAYMTLGEYPDKVPPRSLIPPAVFASEHDIGRFRDVAADLGVDAFGLAGGSIMEDFDQDGDLDLMCSGWSLAEPLHYYRNNADGTFTDATAVAGLAGLHGGLNLADADYDNDGDVDVLVRRGGWLGQRSNHPSSLLRNDGAAYFEDVSEEAGLLATRAGQAAVWGDYDNDGFLDLFLGNEDDGTSSRGCQLFHNQRDGTFADLAPELGLAALGFVKGAAWGDYNDDGREDLYISRLRAPNLLYRNDGPASPGGGGAARPAWKFTEVGKAAGVEKPIDSFAAWFWDYDNDGRLDLFAAGFNNATVVDIGAQAMGLPHGGELPRLYRNNGDGTFADKTTEARVDRVILVMGANHGDLDNDGFEDMYLGTGSPDLRALLPNRMFRNSGGRIFQDVTASGGFGQLQKGHGVAFGDLDNDGDQDIYADIGGWYTSDGYYNALFENPGHGNRWMTLRLRGVSTNRAGVGARIRIRVREAGGTREIHALAGTGGSFGCSSLQQEIGLGKAAAIEEVRIFWPVSGKRVSCEGAELDGFFEAREDSAQLRRIPVRSFRFREKAAAAPR